MRIAILGGTGDVGEGLALRWGYDTDHEIIVGSRDADRATNRAAEYERELTDRGVSVSISGRENAEAAAAGEVVVAAVPPYHLVDTIEGIAENLTPETILVSPAVGMQRDEAGMHYNRPGAGSVTALANSAAPAGVEVVGAFHNLAAGRLANLDADLSMDVLLIGDGEPVETVADLAEAIDGLGTLYAGPIENAPEVEGLTPLLINLAEYNAELQNVGVRFE